MPETFGYCSNQCALAPLLPAAGLCGGAHRHRGSHCYGYTDGLHPLVFQELRRLRPNQAGTAGFAGRHVVRTAERCCAPRGAGPIPRGRFAPEPIGGLRVLIPPVLLDQRTIRAANQYRTGFPTLSDFMTASTEPRFPIWLGSPQRNDIVAWRSAGVRQFTLNQDSHWAREGPFEAPWSSLRSIRDGPTSPVGSSSFVALDPHAGSGGDRSRRPSIRRRISANNARGTATSASWNTR